MYIDDVRTLRRIFPAFVAFALLVGGEAAVYCTAPGCATMPCCSRSSHCDFNLRAGSCCGLDQAPVTPDPAAGQVAPVAMSRLLQRPHPGTIDLSTPRPIRPTVHGFGESPGHPPPHDHSAPLFLRNVSILC